jgi:hypothetical protein
LEHSSEGVLILKGYVTIKSGFKGIEGFKDIERIWDTHLLQPFIAQV